jgi:hypothetical protein
MWLATFAAGFHNVLSVLSHPLLERGVASDRQSIARQLPKVPDKGLPKVPDKIWKMFQRQAPSPKAGCDSLG